MTRTQLPEARLVEIRAAAHQSVGRFVDPYAMAECRTVLARRGEEWAASVLGRSLERRSWIDTRVPWLTDAEPYALIAADRAETAWALDELS